MVSVMPSDSVMVSVMVAVMVSVMPSDYSMMSVMVSGMPTLGGALCGSDSLSVGGVVGASNEDYYD